jgi:hypothetical protein
MEYEHDVFLSYRRNKEWPKWVSETFYSIFDHWLDAELDRDCSIFVDNQLETGQNWPANLANHLSKSRVLVPLWSSQYFNSEWCLKEMALFAARENATGFGTPHNSQRLIILAAIHDGDSFPLDARIIQFKEIQELCNIRIAKGGNTEEKLSNEIRSWVPDICKAINNAPPFDPLWKTIAHEQFIALFRKKPTNPKMPRL